MFYTVLSRCSTAATRSLMLLRNYSVDIDFQKLINNNKVVIFIKGTREKPRCGYSYSVVKLLEAHGVEFDSHDVLDDADFKDAIKTLSNWPTFPQVYIGGDFVGGHDLIFEKHYSGELGKILEEVGIISQFTKSKKST